MTESEVIRIINRHCTEQKLKFFAHVYRGTKGYILDGFAMSQAYRGMKTIGYEVKVSRSDFLRDKKWENYLPVCNTFYFVSPPEVINKEDLPDGIGLYHVVDNHLACVKKAKRKDFDKDAMFEVLQYLTLSRGLSERMKIKSAISQMHIAQSRASRLERELRETRRHLTESCREINNLRRGRVSEYRIWKDGKPCNHPGCLSHISHPCEGCGRIGGKRVMDAKTEEDGGGTY